MHLRTLIWTTLYFSLVMLFGIWDSMWTHAATSEISSAWTQWLQSRWLWATVFLLLPSVRLLAGRGLDVAPGLIWIGLLAAAQWTGAEILPWLFGFAILQVVAALLRNGVERKITRPMVATILLFISTFGLGVFLTRSSAPPPLGLNVIAYLATAFAWLWLPLERPTANSVLLHPAWTFAGAPFGPLWKRDLHHSSSPDQMNDLWVQALRIGCFVMILWMMILWMMPWISRWPVVLGMSLWLSSLWIISSALNFLGMKHLRPMQSPWRARSPLELIRRLDYWSWLWATQALRRVLRSKIRRWRLPGKPLTVMLAGVLSGLTLHNTWKIWIALSFSSATIWLLMSLAQRAKPRGKTPK